MMENNYMMENNERNVLKLLMQMEIPKPKEKRVRLRRLSEECGEDVVFTLRQTSYSRLMEIRAMKDHIEGDVQLVLTGVVSPNLKDKDLMDKYNAVTPAELMKKLLEAGEIVSLVEEILKLNGYGVNTVQAVGKET